MPLLVFACILVLPVQGEEQKRLPYNLTETNKAWGCVNTQDWQGAVRHADLVISHFSKLAAGIHDLLASKIKTHEAETPPIGSPSDRQKTATFRYGLMNDVATCYYIKAKSLFALYTQRKGANAPEAELASIRAKLKSAYATCLKYPLARCWDPQGWFWSPAQGVQQDVDLEKVKP